MSKWLLPHGATALPASPCAPQTVILRTKPFIIDEVLTHAFDRHRDCVNTLERRYDELVAIRTGKDRVGGGLRKSDLAEQTAIGRIDENA